MEKMPEKTAFDIMLEDFDKAVLRIEKSIDRVIESQLEDRTVIQRHSVEINELQTINKQTRRNYGTILATLSSLIAFGAMLITLFK